MAHSRQHESDTAHRAREGSDTNPEEQRSDSMQRAEAFGENVSRNVSGAVRTTEQLGSGLVGGATHIASDLVHGVAGLGQEIGHGASGLINAAGEVGNAAVGTVADLLVNVVGGVRQVVNAAVRGVPDGAARKESAKAEGQEPSTSEEWEAQNKS